MAIHGDTGKRFKNVVNAEQVAHLWANKSQPQAYTQSRNLYFESKTIYSYGSHYPIASFTGLVSLEGEVVLFNCNGNSVTTEKQKGYVQGALRGHIVKVFYVNDPLADSQRPFKPSNCKPYHQKNASDYIRRINGNISCAMKAHGRAISYLSAAQNLHKEYSEYCKLFLKTKGASFESIFNATAKNASQYKELLARGKAHKLPDGQSMPLTALEMFEHDAREMKAKHDKAQEKRSNTRSDLQQRQEMQRRAALEARALQVPIDRADWLSGKEVKYPQELQRYSYPQNASENSNGVEFRVIRGGAVTQSSLGAEIPTRAVKALFLKLHEMVAHSKSNPPYAQACAAGILNNPAIGSFKIDTLGEDDNRRPTGDFKAGCHYVKWNNVVDFATRLGWMNSDGSLNKIGIDYVP